MLTIGILAGALALSVTSGASWGFQVIAAVLIAEQLVIVLNALGLLPLRSCARAPHVEFFPLGQVDSAGRENPVQVALPLPGEPIRGA